MPVSSDQLPRSFYAQPALQVARQLLGTTLIHIEDGVRVGGMIIETEAYIGEEDLACHAKAGRTTRTAVMYGEPGIAYVYFIYGMHWMFNCIPQPKDSPAGILIRALYPTEGLDVIQERRKGHPRKSWADGPAKLSRALNITKAQNGLDLCDPHSPIFIERGTPIPDSAVTITPRVGLNNVPEPWKFIPWRFLVPHPADLIKTLQ